MPKASKAVWWAGLLLAASPGATQELLYPQGPAAEVTLAVDFHVRPGKEEAFKALMLPHIRRSRAEPGCLIFNLHQDVRRPTHFVLYEKWRDQRAFREHIAQPYTQKLRLDRRDLLAEDFLGGVAELVDLVPAGQTAK